MKLHAPSKTSFSFSAKVEIKNDFWKEASASASRMPWGGPFIRHNPIRLSLGRLSISIACLRFTGLNKSI